MTGTQSTGLQLRRVTSHEYVGACRYTGYQHKSIRLTLECGHEMTRKASAGVPVQAHCHTCKRDGLRRDGKTKNKTPGAGAPGV